MRSFPTPTAFFEERERNFNAICDAKDALIGAEGLTDDEHDRREAGIHRCVAADMVELLIHVREHQGDGPAILYPKLCLEVLARLTALLSKTFTLPFQRNYEAARDGRPPNQGQAISVWHNLHAMLYYRLKDREIAVIDGGHATINDEEATEVLVELICLIPLLQAEADGHANDESIALATRLKDPMALPILAGAACYARDRLNLRTIIQAAEEAQRMNPRTPHGRLGLLRSLQIIGEYCTEQHLSGPTQALAIETIDFKSLVHIRNRLSHPEKARVENLALLKRVETETRLMDGVHVDLRNLTPQFKDLQRAHQAACATWEDRRAHVERGDDAPYVHSVGAFRAHHLRHVESLFIQQCISRRTRTTLRDLLEVPLTDASIHRLVTELHRQSEITLQRSKIYAAQAHLTTEPSTRQLLQRHANELLERASRIRPPAQANTLHLQTFARDVWFWQSCGVQSPLKSRSDRQVLPEQAKMIANMLEGILPVTVASLRGTLPDFRDNDVKHFVPHLSDLLHCYEPHLQLGTAGLASKILRFHQHTGLPFALVLQPGHDGPLIGRFALHSRHPGRLPLGVTPAVESGQITIKLFLGQRSFNLRDPLRRYGQRCAIYLKFLEHPSTLPAIVFLIGCLQSILKELKSRELAVVPTFTMEFFRVFRNIMVHGNTLLETNPDAIPSKVITHHLPELIKLLHEFLEEPGAVAAPMSDVALYRAQADQLMRESRPAGALSADQRDLLNLRTMLKVLYLFHCKELYLFHFREVIPDDGDAFLPKHCLEYLVRLSQQLSDDFKALYPSQPGAGTVWDQFSTLSNFRFGLQCVTRPKALAIAKELLTHLPTVLRAECTGTLAERQCYRFHLGALNLPQTYEVAEELRRREAGPPIGEPAHSQPPGPPIPPPAHLPPASPPPSPRHPPPNPGSDAAT